jgi:carbamoyltransferase
MVDGALRALAAEERFSRCKNDHGYPKNAIDFCLNACGVSATDIDRVAFAGNKMNIFGVRLKALCNFTSDDWIRIENEYWRPLLYDGVDNPDVFHRLYQEKAPSVGGHYYEFDGITPQEAFRSTMELGNRIRLEAVKRHLDIGPDNIMFFDHHRCHAAYALFASPVRGDNTLVFTLDGGGDATTSTVHRFKNGCLDEIARSNAVDTARIYRYVTMMLGMKLGEHEYKVMGLAPYAPEREVRKSWEVFKGMFTVSEDVIAYAPGRKPVDLYFTFKEAFDAHRFDGIAAATQMMVESSVLQWFRETLGRFKATRAAFAGGVAMNVKLNQVLSERLDLDQFGVPPSPSDDTLCIGSCYLAEMANSPQGWEKLHPVDNPYLGKRFSRADVEKAIQSSGAKDRYRVKEHISADEIAGLLADGKVVSRMAGPMEFGQRALGNRSILADPSRGGNVDKINHQIKYRDFWMPFAPVIMEERVGDYLRESSHNTDRSYMMIAADTTDKGKRELIAAIHNGDQSARPQVVNADQNEGYYRIIKHFEERTGIGALLNTSFNLHGEPIVCSPEDAISTFERSELDVVVMEDMALLREESGDPR